MYFWPILRAYNIAWRSHASLGNQGNIFFKLANLLGEFRTIFSKNPLLSTRYLKHNLISNKGTVSLFLRKRNYWLARQFHSVGFKITSLFKIRQSTENMPK